MADINFIPSGRGVRMRVNDGRGQRIDLDLTAEQYIEIAVAGAIAAGLPTPWKG